MPSIASATVANYTRALQERLQTTLASVAATVTDTTRLQLNSILRTTTTTAAATAQQTEATEARLSNVVNQDDVAVDVTTTAAAVGTSLPTFSAPHVASLVASSAEDLSGGFRDVTFDIFDDEHDLYGSPLAFDASEHGLWNGRFVPPPPRPPFFVDEPVLSDGLTTCDLCSWAMPTKSTFIFEGTIEKATELGWPLTLIIVSVLSALLGAIIMIAVVRCRRKKSSNHRNDTHVQWWSRNKRPNAANAAGAVGGHHNNANNNNHLRRSNIYTAHPADSIRGLQPLPPQQLQQQQQHPQQPPPTLSASSSLTAMTAAAMMANMPTVPTIQQQQQQQHYHPYHPQQQQQQQHLHHHHQQHQQHHHGPQPNAHLHHQQQQQHHQLHQLPHEYVDDYEEEHEYHQPQELQLQLQMPLQQQHQRQHSSSMSSVITSPSPSLLHANMLPQSQPRSSLELQQDGPATVATVAGTRHWPQASTMVVAS